MVEIEFYVVYYRGEPQLLDAFDRIKNIAPAKVIAFWNIENTGNYITRTDFNRDFPKMTIFGISKPTFCYIFYPTILKRN